MEQERDFKGVWFPKEVWLDTRITALEKMILLEIDSLDNENGCYASNEYLAEFCQCSERKVSESIRKLIEYDYVCVKSFDGRVRVLQSRLSKTASQSSKNCEAELQNLRQSNIIENNNKDNIIYIIDYLNKSAGTHYRVNNEKTKRLINSRLKEKFEIEDFVKVIDNKCKEWLNTDMEQYLRPETLFGTKFESYLNQKPLNRKQGTTQQNDFIHNSYSKDQIKNLITNLDEVEV